MLYHLHNVFYFTQFIIDISLPISQDLSLTVYNSLGDQIIYEEGKNTNGEKYEIDLGSVSNGIYMVKIQTDTQSLVKRITVAR